MKDMQRDQGRLGRRVGNGHFEHEVWGTGLLVVITPNSKPTPRQQSLEPYLRKGTFKFKLTKKP